MSASKLTDLAIEISGLKARVVYYELIKKNPNYDKIDKELKEAQAILQRTKDHLLEMKQLSEVREVKGAPL